MDNEKGIPLAIIAAFWAAFDGVINASKIINERRDLILFGKSGQKLPTEYQIQILNSDWLPLSMGITVSCIFFSVVVFVIPRIAKSTDKLVKVLCNVMAGVIFSASFAFGWFGYSDYKVIKNQILKNTHFEKNLGSPTDVPTDSVK